jgi:type III pantothenate kinase
VPQVPLVAVDIGNSRIKLGLFNAADSCCHELPQPLNMQSVAPNLPANEIARWLPPQLTDAAWVIASVQRATSKRLVGLLQQHGVARVTQLTAANLPLTVALPEPDRVGIDRLASAAAANRLREAGRGAIVIDLGSAITVDAVDARGQFLGGAILPGIGMSARALHQFTDLLPLSEMTELREAPPPLGTNTTSALRSGLFWGAVGAIRELVARLSVNLPSPQLFLTGGAAPSVVSYLSAPDGSCPLYVPHLTLSGIVLAKTPS